MFLRPIPLRTAESFKQAIRSLSLPLSLYLQSDIINSLKKKKRKKKRPSGLPVSFEEENKTKQKSIKTKKTTTNHSYPRQAVSSSNSSRQVMSGLLSKSPEVERKQIISNLSVYWSLGVNTPDTFIRSTSSPAIY